MGRRYADHARADVGEGEQAGLQLVVHPNRGARVACQRELPYQLHPAGRDGDERLLRQVLRRYPGVVSESEMHSLENLRGIPKELNSDIHLSKIRMEWNRFYRMNPSPTALQLLIKATEIDSLYGSQFNPPIEGN